MAFNNTKFLTLHKHRESTIWQRHFWKHQIRDDEDFEKHMVVGSAHLTTRTHALLPQSPAIDKGDNDLAVDPDGNPLKTDQRGKGYARIRGKVVDIGAFEEIFYDRWPKHPTSRCRVGLQPSLPFPRAGARLLREISSNI